jgi:DNA-binding MurR/RpiR family transcriptional regulator
VSELKATIDRLTADFPGLSTQLRRAAKHVMERPEEVAIKSMRGFAADAGVTPSTMVRLAKAAGFSSYEAFRKPFQDAVRADSGEYAHKAEWLQELGAGHRVGPMLAQMAQTTLANLESTFRNNDQKPFGAAADTLRRARRVYIVGVGAMNALASYFNYVARMALPNLVWARPMAGTMVDDLVNIARRDAALVLSVAPYARDAVRAAEFARREGAAVVAITDNRASPLAPLATNLILVSTTGPQFFPSVTAIVAAMETLIALAVSRGDGSVVARIEAVDRLRREQGFYWEPTRPRRERADG